MKGFTLDDDVLFTFLDTHTASNDLKHGEDGYFTLFIANQNS